MLRALAMTGTRDDGQRCFHSNDSGKHRKLAPRPKKGVRVMISQGEVINILTQAITTVILCAAPMLITAMIVGLLVSIFQATTQINEQTLAFVPKIVCVMLTLLIFGGYIFSTIGGFVTRLFTTINTIIVS